MIHATPTDATEREPIECARQHRKLAYASVQGIWLWCKSCRTEHCISWTMLDTLRQEVHPIQPDVHLPDVP